jgi:signal transduction histidine kinase
MRIIAVYLIFAAVLLRTAIVLADRSELPIVLALLSVYGFLLFVATWLTRQIHLRFLQTSLAQFIYLFLQASLAIVVLVISSYEDFLAMLFIPLSLDAVVFFGRKVGYGIIAAFSAMMIVTLLFSDVGRLFGLAMGIMYSGICFLCGGYAYQIQKAEAAHKQNEATLNELQTAHRQLQGYADQMASLAIENERNRLARELHDSVTQTVFSMNLAAQSAHLLLDKEPPFDTASPVRTAPLVAGQLLHIEELATSAMREIQSLVSQLKPRTMMEEDLPMALRRLAAEHQSRDGLQVSLEVDGKGTLSEVVAASLYSIANEALINVSKHSGVCEATVRLHLEKYHACLEIEDKGRGFDAEAISNESGHLGLASMLERAHEIGWSLSTASRPGQGTCIHVSENQSGDSK